MEAKKDILWRVYLVYLIVCLFAVSILGKIVQIQFFQRDIWKAKAQTLTTIYRNIEAVRGNIFAADGSLLVTSIPVYEIRMDVNAGPITNEIFEKNIDSLSYCLTTLFQDKTQKEYKKELKKARDNGERYHLIQKEVSYKELKKLQTFPIFRGGKYKGGLIYIQKVNVSCLLKILRLEH